MKPNTLIPIDSDLVLHKILLMYGPSAVSLGTRKEICKKHRTNFFLRSPNVVRRMRVRADLTCIQLERQIPGEVDLITLLVVPNDQAIMEKLTLGI